MTAQLPGSPYKGLAPFADTRVDAMLFFGRDRDAEIVCANVVAARLTVLYGPSGVGKSSLLAAAVARRLRDLPEKPVVVLFSSWSAEPAGAIARAVCAAAGIEATDGLGDAVARACALHGDVHLLLDQAEEYFLYNPEGGLLEAELANIVGGTVRCSVLLSLREDALAKLDRFKAVIPGILDNYLRLDRLSRDAARAAVEGPLARWLELGGEQVEIEPELAERVLDEVAAGRIRAGLGGTGRVAADRPGEAIEAPFLQLVMERIWEVERARGSSVLHAATLDELGGAAEVVAQHLEGAMDALTADQQRVAFDLLRQLVTPSGAKIAHASSDLAGYAGVGDEEALAVLDTLSARRILRVAEDGRYEIYHDVLAAPILAWRARYAHAQELVAAHRRNRRLALLAAAALAALVVTTLVAVFALVQRSNARADARVAHARELDAVAVTLLGTDPELGLLLARDAAVVSPSATAEDVLRDALKASRVRRIVDIGKPLLGAVAVGDTVVTAATDGSVVVVGPGSRRGVATGTPAVAADVTRHGVVLLTGRDGRLRLVSGATVHEVPRVEHAVGAELSDDATVAAVRFRGEKGQPSRIVHLVDVRTGAVRLAVDHGAPVTAVAISEAGVLLATGGVDRRTRMWRIATGKSVLTVSGHVGQISGIAFSPRGDLFATASTDGQGRVWRLRDGTAVAVLYGHQNYLTDIAFSRDGRQVVTASRDLTARSWKSDTGASLLTYSGDTEAVTSAAYAASGNEVVTASLDGTARIWDAVTQPVMPLVVDLGKPVTRVAYSADGRRLSADAGGRSYRIALPHGPAIDVGRAPRAGKVVTGPGGVRAVIHGKRVVVTHPDGSTVELVGHKNRVLSVAFSPDGKRVVTASGDHNGAIWDTQTGAPIHVLLGHFAVVSGAEFSPDGRWVVTAGPGTAGLWWAATGHLVYYLRGNTDKLLSVAFAPDGKRLATGGADGTVHQWACNICGGIDDLVALADERLAATGRVATPEERARYGL